MRFRELLELFVLQHGNTFALVVTSLCAVYAVWLIYRSMERPPPVTSILRVFLRRPADRLDRAARKLQASEPWGSAPPTIPKKSEALATANPRD